VGGREGRAEEGREREGEKEDLVLGDGLQYQKKETIFAKGNTFMSAPGQPFPSVCTTFLHIRLPIFE
jgi:hypothetical protein